ncbi:zf-HC2 domain-containing protein [Butyricicoccus sp. OM06-6AC]|nr:zf-HC2 domain-containing protein [Butyricicoccus sp. OM06-6AC]
MNEEEYFEQLCSNSVDGTLTDSEKQKLEEHLAECPSCAALKEDLEQMHSMLAVDETEPPAGLHDSIMERLRQEETVRVVAPQKPMRRLPVFTMVAAAAVVVLVVLGGGLMPASVRWAAAARRQRIPLRRTQETARRTAVCRMRSSSPYRRTPIRRAAEHRIRACSRAARLRRAWTAAHTADRMTPARTLRRIRRAMRASMPSSMQTAIGRSQLLSRSQRSRYRRRCRPVRCSRCRKACTAHTPRTAMWPSAAAACRISMVSCSRRRTAFRGSGWTTVWKRSKRLCRQ